MQKKLYKISAQRKVSGVCAGFAEYFDRPEFEEENGYCPRSAQDFTGRNIGFND